MNLKVGEDIISDLVQVANKFNDFFIESVKDLATNVPHINTNRNVEASDEDVSSSEIREVDQSVVSCLESY